MGLFILIGFADMNNNYSDSNNGELTNIEIGETSVFVPLSWGRTGVFS